MEVYVHSWIVFRIIIRKTWFWPQLKYIIVYYVRCVQHIIPYVIYCYFHRPSAQFHTPSEISLQAKYRSTKLRHRQGPQPPSRHQCFFMTSQTKIAYIAAYMMLSFTIIQCIFGHRIWYAIWYCFHIFQRTTKQSKKFANVHQTKKKGFSTIYSGPKFMTIFDVAKMRQNDDVIGGGVGAIIVFSWRHT